MPVCVCERERLGRLDVVFHQWSPLIPSLGVLIERNLCLSSLPVLTGSF